MVGWDADAPIVEVFERNRRFFFNVLVKRENLAGNRIEYIHGCDAQNRNRIGSWNEPQITGSIFQYPMDEIRAEPIVGFVKNFEPQAIKTRYSAVGRHPNKAPAILQNTVDLPMRQAILEIKPMDNRQVVLRWHNYPKTAQKAEQNEVFHQIIDSFWDVKYPRSKLSFLPNQIVFCRK